MGVESHKVRPSSPEDGGRIAIVAMGGLFPSAANPKRLWANVLAGVDAAREVPPGRWLLDPRDAYDPAIARPDRVYSLRGCFLEEIPRNHAGLSLPADLLAQLDPVFHLALHAGRQAFESGATHTLDRRRIGVILGNIALPTERVSALARAYLGRTFAEKASGPVSPIDLPSPLNRHVPGLVAGVLAKALGLGGGSYTLDAACASSLYALKLAVDELRSGRADAMLAGGVSRPDCLYTQMGFSQLRALSPSGRCSPFDARADGLVVGEGAGVFLLKRLEDALRDDDRILAVIAGIGLSNDVGGNLLAPNSAGQLRAMRAAYREAGWTPAEVDLIECHATGTPVGDSVEFQSLRSLWGETGWRPGQCAIGSVKSTVGHLLTAAGAAGMVKILSAFQAAILPPTANFRTPAPGMDFAASPFRILHRGEAWHRRNEQTPRRAAVSAFGFGGVNAHVLLEEWLPASGIASAPRVRPTRGADATPLAEQPIAIVGMAAHFGPWKSLRAFQHRVFGGDNSLSPSPPPHWWGVPDSAWFREQGLQARSFAGWYVGPEATVHAERFRIPPRELQETLPQQLLMLQVAADALDATAATEERRPNTSVFIGIGLDLNTTNFHFRWSLQPEWRDAAGPPLTASRTMGSLGSIVASRIAREFHLGGPSFTISSEENSGLHALQAAVRALRQGEIEQAIVGAVDLAGDVRAVLATHQQRPFSSRGRVCPFDAEADGTVPGEGAAAVILKRLDDAVRDGDTIHAVIKGIGVAGGGGVDAAAPDPAVYQTALERAYAAAGVDPASVAYVETHGSGHPAEDRAEAQALAAFFDSQTRPHPLVLGSAKADVGHTGAAAGFASLIKVCICLDQQILPPLRHLSQEREEVLGRFLLPRAPRYWLRDRAAGPRRAGLSSLSVDGNCVHVVLEGWEPAACVDRPDRRHPLGRHAETLFAIEGRDARTLAEGLGRLRTHMGAMPNASLQALAGDWYEKNPLTPALPTAVSLVARDRPELVEQIELAQHSLREDPSRPFALRPASRDRVFYAPVPLGRTGRVAFVFPGSGNDFPGMGRDLGVHWPDILRRQDAENDHLQSQYLPQRFWDDTPAEACSVRERILGQVTLGSLVSDVVRRFGVRADAVIGYSLGESAGLFALRAWTDRDAMLRAMNESSLFVRDLAGPCDAVRKAWRLPPETPVDWVSGVVDRAPSAVRGACSGLRRVYLLIVNTPRECVIGGERDAVHAVVQRLGCKFLPLPETSTVHCPVVREVAEAYRELHRLPTTVLPGTRFYSTALARSFELNPDSAAEAILAQALDTVDFPSVIESAYRDGVRIFLETGPGASCTRMIGAILGDRPHRARSACVAGMDGVSQVLRLLAQLCAERVPVDLAPLYGPETIAHATPPRVERRLLSVPIGGQPFLVPAEPAGRAPIPTEYEPPKNPPIEPIPEPQLLPYTANGAAEVAPLISQTVTARESTGQAHAAYLRLSATLQRGLMDNLQFQARLFEAATNGDPVGWVERSEAHHTPGGPRRASTHPTALDRAQCLEFAVGSIARVLGPDFAPIDSYPTRVRLPDEPLMLVDRILSIEGQPRALGSGRVVTEHDIHAGAWYLDGGRIATCIAIEAGQADLFLSAFLGIDLQTRGLAVYRLLDAAVTFHRGLPRAGQIIRYDIRIERFFRQGDTYLFKFGFEGSVDGEPLLTMTNGCAGFFTDADLAAGKGVVQTSLDTRPRPGVQPDDAADLPLLDKESYSAEQLDALRSGDPEGCFGSPFAGRRLQDGLRLPGGRMKLVDRVTHLDPKGGRFGMGLIRAEADIAPDAWFLTCHFVDDQVMPGTLMYECCLHTLRIYLLRLGWIADADDIVCEPVPGVASVLKCRGQVTAATRTVTYEVILKERGYRPEPYALADALMYADGKPIVEITNMSVRLTGLTHEMIAAGWSNPMPNAECRMPNERYSAFGIRHSAFEKRHILAFASGKPSAAFGEPYRIFDEGRFVARLPAPPYSFIDRISQIEAEQYKMVAGGVLEAQYDVPPDAWYFAAERQQTIPFAVLNEVALQSCGFLAAYVGSALTSPVDLAFRNLEGEAELIEPVYADAGTLTTRVRLLRVATSGGMIIQSYEFAVRRGSQPVYRGQTTFGFFSRDALAQQVGIREAKPYEQTNGRSFDYPREAPFPDERLSMIDRIECFVPDGGPHGLGFIEGRKIVDPGEWFFQAHFYQDPVWPGSLGLEAFLQLLKAAAVECWPNSGNVRFLACPGKSHRWRYRGQVVPTSKNVTVQAVITSREDATRQLTADGFLLVDGLIIYQMNDFTLRVDGSP